MLEIKNTVPKMRNAFDRLFSRLDTAKEESLSLRILSIETSKPEMQREQREKSRTEYPRTAGQLQKVYHMYNGNTTSRREGERK